jgi:hypothetical protein
MDLQPTYRFYIRTFAGRFATSLLPCQDAGPDEDRLRSPVMVANTSNRNLSEYAVARLYSIDTQCGFNSGHKYDFLRVLLLQPPRLSQQQQLDKKPTGDAIPNAPVADLVIED